MGCPDRVGIVVEMQEVILGLVSLIRDLQKAKAEAPHKALQQIPARSGSPSTDG
jgi:hypothetical protein